MVAKIQRICRVADRTSNPPCKKHCKYNVFMRNAAKRRFWDHTMWGGGGVVANREPGSYIVVLYICISNICIYIYIYACIYVILCVDVEPALRLKSLQKTCFIQFAQVSWIKKVNRVNFWTAGLQQPVETHLFARKGNVIASVIASMERPPAFFWVLWAANPNDSEFNFIQGFQLVNCSFNFWFWGVVGFLHWGWSSGCPMGWDEFFLIPPNPFPCFHHFAFGCCENLMQQRRFHKIFHCSNEGNTRTPCGFFRQCQIIGESPLIRC